MRTKLDNFLIARGTLYRCSVRSLPRQLPAGTKIEMIENATPRTTWRFNLIVGSLDMYHSLLVMLRSERMMWEASILTREGWGWALKEGSRTYEALWFILSLAFGAVLCVLGFGWIKQSFKVGAYSALLARI